MKFDMPSLPFEDIAILDAAGLANGLSTGESLYVTYVANTGKYYLKSRTFNYDVEWDTHFKVSLDQAREIVRLGYAHWWMVPEEFQ